MHLIILDYLIIKIIGFTKLGLTFVYEEVSVNWP